MSLIQPALPVVIIAVVVAFLVVFVVFKRLPTNLAWFYNASFQTRCLEATAFCVLGEQTCSLPFDEEKGSCPFVTAICFRKNLETTSIVRALPQGSSPALGGGFLEEA